MNPGKEKSQESEAAPHHDHGKLYQRVAEIKHVFVTNHCGLRGSLQAWCTVNVGQGDVGPRLSRLVLRSNTLRLSSGPNPNVLNVADIAASG